MVEEPPDEVPDRALVVGGVLGLISYLTYLFLPISVGWVVFVLLLVIYIYIGVVDLQRPLDGLAFKRPYEFLYHLLVFGVLGLVVHLTYIFLPVYVGRAAFILLICICMGEEDLEARFVMLMTVVSFVFVVNSWHPMINVQIWLWVDGRVMGCWPVALAVSISILLLAGAKSVVVRALTFYSLSHLVGGVLAFVLAVVPALCFSLDGVRVRFPKGRNGTLAALAFNSLDICFSVKTQWWFFAAYLFYLLLDNPGEFGAITLEAVVSWAFGFSPAFSYTVSVVAKTIIHPMYRVFAREVDLTIDVDEKMTGTLWFISTYLGFEAARKAFGLSTFSVLWIMAILLFIFIIAIELYGYYYTIRYRETRSQTAAATGDTWAITSNTPYTYRPLPDDRTIRLLRIRSSLSRSKVIQCDMVTGHFSDSLFTGPLYSAISYRWDDAKVAKKSISINGQPFDVYPTVYEILKNLRPLFGVKFIWIDSVCINQEDDREKASQVRLMRNIYEQCLVVDCWIGRKWTDSNSLISRGLFDISDTTESLACSMIKILGTSRFVEDISREIRPDDFLKQFQSKDWKALQELVSSAYFTRVWIIQEVVASQRVCLHYGDFDISWDDFARAMSALSSHGLKNFVYYARDEDQNQEEEPSDQAQSRYSSIDLRGIDNALVMENLRHWYGRERTVPGQRAILGVRAVLGLGPVLGQEAVLGYQPDTLLSLGDTLKLCLRFDSSLEVDRVFALLGLIREDDRANIIPDYTKGTETVIRVFIQVAKLMLEQSNPDRVLRFAGVGRRRNIHGLPSWVPDWTAGLQTSILCPVDEASKYSAYLGLRPVVDLSPCFDKILFHGIVFDHIKEIGDIFTGTSQPGHSQFKDTLALVQAHLTEPYEKGRCRHSLDEAFYRTVIGDIDPNFKTRPASATPHDFLSLWREVIKDFENPLEQAPSSDRREEMIDARVNARAICSSNDSDDSRFAHLLSTDLAQGNPDNHSALTSILQYDPTKHLLAQNPLPAFGRRLCVSSDGYIGLVPRQAEPGDLIAIFAGSSVPHVIRESYGGYLLVGECYIHGAMDGEAFEAYGGSQAMRDIVLL